MSRVDDILAELEAGKPEAAMRVARREVESARLNELAEQNGFGDWYFGVDPSSEKGAALVRLLVEQYASLSDVILKTMIVSMAYETGDRLGLYPVLARLFREEADPDVGLHFGAILGRWFGPDNREELLQLAASPGLDTGRAGLLLKLKRRIGRDREVRALFEKLKNDKGQQVSRVACEALAAHEKRQAKKAAAKK